MHTLDLALHLRFHERQDALVEARRDCAGHGIVRSEWKATGVQMGVFRARCSLLTRPSGIMLISPICVSARHGECGVR